MISIKYIKFCNNSVYNSRRQLCLQIQSTTLIYYSALQSLLTITAEDPPTTPATTTTTAVTEVVFAFRAKNFEKYHFENK